MAAHVLHAGMLLLVVFCCLPGCLSVTLRDSGISVPPLQERDTIAYLSCNYDEDEQDAYVNVTWYKDNVEVAQTWTKGLETTTTTKNVPGVNIDVEDSGVRGLTLNPVKVNSGGDYRCVAFSNKNRVTSQTKTMLVVSRPLSDPVINGLQEAIWVPNGTLPLNCTSGKAFPVPKLTWLVRGEEVDKNRVTTWPEEEDEEGLKTSKIGFALQLGPNPRTEKVEVTCRSVFDEKFIHEWPGATSATNLRSVDTVSITVTAGAAQPAAVLLLLLLCSVTAAMAF